MPPGQVDRLDAALHCSRERPRDLNRRLVGQTGELQIRSSDLARQRHALFQVPLGLVELARPVLGGAQVDERQRTQVLAQARPRRARNVSYALQPAGFLDNRGQVAALAGVQQPGNPQQQLRLPVPLGRH